MKRQRYSAATAMTLSALLAATVAGGAAAQRNRTTIPENTIVRLKLSEKLSSRTAERGMAVSARLDEEDRSGFPEGTRFEGTVTDVRRSNKDRPALLDMEFRRAILPSGAAEVLDAELASLAEDDVRRTEDGRLESRKRGDRFDWKWVGIGVGGGAVLGEVFGDDWLRGGLLGGLGGAIYGYLNRDKERGYHEVELDRDTTFGIRLNREVAFRSSSSYRFGSRDRFNRDRMNQHRTSSRRDEYRLSEAKVLVNGRRVDFGDTRPMRVNGSVYIPLRPVAEAASWDLNHYRGSDEFTLKAGQSELRAAADEAWLRRNGRDFRMDAAPMRIGGDIYVPVEFLSRFGETRANWDGQTRQLEITSYGRDNRASR